MNIRIAIADDHPMIIGGLQNMLAGYPHIILSATYNDGKTLLAGLESDVPDVLLLDIQLPGKAGDRLAPQILKKYPDLRILTLTNMDSMLYVYNMLRIGVHGYVLKTSDPDTVINAIESIFRGEQFLDPRLEDKLKHYEFRQKKEKALRPSLTLKEKDILRLIVNGCTIREISEKLFIGVRTVEYYRTSLFAKMEVKNMAGLIRKALESGLTD